MPTCSNSLTKLDDEELSIVLSAHAARDIDEAWIKNTPYPFIKFVFGYWYVDKYDVCWTTDRLLLELEKAGLA